MGYRSEVKSVIYGEPREVQLLKEACFDLYNQITEAFGDALRQVNLSDDVSMIYLDCDYIKWYDDDEDVQRWHEFLDIASDVGLNTEFVRVGESSDGDIEQHFEGKNNRYYLTPKVSIDVGFNYYRNNAGV